MSKEKICTCRLKEDYAKAFFIGIIGLCVMALFGSMAYLGLIIGVESTVESTANIVLTMIWAIGWNIFLPVVCAIIALFIFGIQVLDALGVEFGEEED